MTSYKLHLQVSLAILVPLFCKSSKEHLHLFLFKGDEGYNRRIHGGNQAG